MSIKKNIYRTGYEAEMRAKRMMERWGYLVVRSSKSGGPFDLVGIGRSNFFLVQVKVCPKGKVPSFEKLRRELRSIPVPMNARKEIWVWEKRVGFHCISV